MAAVLLSIASWFASSLVPTSLFSTFTLSVPLIAFRMVTNVNRRRTRAQHHVKKAAKTVAFFHPYCDDGGGGERVLWRAIYALSKLSHEKNVPLHILIYVGGSEDSQAILNKARDTFGIDLTTADTVPITFVRLQSRMLLEPMYPVFTVLGQSLGAVVVSTEALLRATPDVFFDSTGWAFSYFGARLFGCDVGAYVHYPTVSTDMLRAVRKQRPAVHNGERIAQSWLLTALKIAYYHAFALLYCTMGALPQVVMVNSSWTQGHINKLWSWRKKKARSAVVYPPCNTEELQALPLNEDKRERLVVSVAQFRPEKNHALQLQAFAELKQRGSQYSDVKLRIIGGCRNDADRAYLKKLQKQCSELQLDSSVEFSQNVSHSELVSALSRASAGLHTMADEHFGIGIVEMLAAGVVTVAHNSGGPAADILAQHDNSKLTHLLHHGSSSNSTSTPAGYLATTAEEYADCLANVLGVTNNSKIAAVRTAGREAAKRYSDAAFDSAFTNAFKPLIGIKK